MGSVFDRGLIVQEALYRYRIGKTPLECGGRGIRTNGNGSLMRILPIVFYAFVRTNGFETEDHSAFVTPIHEVSALTHAHPISMMGCGISAQLIAALIRCRQEHVDRGDLQQELQKAVDAAWKDYEIHRLGNSYQDDDFAEHLKCYERLTDLFELGWLPERDIKSTGYVVDTLEAALWCLFFTENFRDCVLEAVNLGGDTDTIAAVAGSFAAIYYGVEDIPADWLQSIPRLEWIEEMIKRFVQSLDTRDES